MEVNMADPENFEEDLFADLYTEDDNAVKTGTETAVEAKVDPVQPISKFEETPKEEQRGGDGEQQMYGGEQDADDDIDFNLGNSNGYDHAKTDFKNEDHGPGIKEDG